MKREMTDLESLLSREAYAAIQQATNSTARSQQQAEFRLGVSNIGHCFAGETEVPTREGIRPIASLAGGEAELLVPTRSGVRAEWRRVEVRAFGVQPLMRITLSTLGGVTREVYATADHEWFVTRSARNRNYSTVRTQDLVPGQRMREARAGNPKACSLIPAAAVMGFIHGDGNKRHSDSEVAVALAGNKAGTRMEELLKGFCGTTSVMPDRVRYRGFPRSWKDIPDFAHETPSFALSWLAGYFAADGSVQRGSSGVIQSSERASLDAVRFAAVLAGVHVGNVVSRTMKGGLGLAPDEERQVYTITLRCSTVPDWFFLNDFHAAGIGDRQRDGAWSVVSVEETDRVEEVYCAVVPGEEAFVLTEGLATHNCREYARRMVKQMPFTDVRDKTAAFLGTVIGDAVERALAERHPGWVFQPELTFTLPSGGEILGHADIVIPWEARTEEFPQAVIDIKTRAELDSIRRYGASQQQAFQKAMYCSAAIDAGYLNPEEPIIVANMWIDRSGVEVTPYVLAEEYDPNTLLAVDAWVEDVKYAVIHDEEASRDKSREWCWSYCEHATGCRGNDTDAEGLIDDPEALAAVETYVEAGDLEREAKRMKNSAKIALRGVNGSTGSHTVRWVSIGETSYEVHREASVRLDVRPVPKKKQTTA